MESIRIEKTAKTPLVIMKDGYIRMSGRSIPQNARQLYKICFDWVDRYMKNPAANTVIELFFEYIDTASIRCVVDILTKLGSARGEGRQIEVNWYYETGDEDSYDLGAYIQAHLKAPFDIIELEEGGDIPPGSKTGQVTEN